MACLLLLAQAPGEAPAEGEEGARLREAVAALRYLVDDERWSATTARITRDEFRSQQGNLPREEWVAHAAGFVDGYSLRAQSEGTGARILLGVLEFSDELGAATNEALMRRVFTGAPAGPAGQALSVLEGVGGDGQRPGFRVRHGPSTGSGKGTLRVHLLRRGRVVATLIFVDAPFVDDAAQEAALERMDAYLMDPTTARQLPAPPTPRVPEGDHQGLVVRVLDPQGDPVPAAQVAVTCRGDSPLPLRVSGRCVDGRCSLRVPRLGGVVEAWRALGQDGTPLPVTTVEPVPYAPGAAEVVLRMAPGLTIEGRVAEADGAPARGIVVKARPSNRSSQAVHHAETRTDAEGAFQLVGLLEATYTLALERDGQPATAAQFEHEAGEGDVHLRLHPVRTVRLTIVDHLGEPVAFARVRVARHADGVLHEVRAVARQDGSLVIEGLDPTQQHELLVDPTFATSPVAPLRLASWTPQDGSVPMPRGWTLRGTVVDAQGRPVAGHIDVRGVLLHRHGGHAGADGAFELFGLAYGPVEVAALRHGVSLRKRHEHLASPWSRFEPTDEPVTLTLTEPE